jgi:hypothetical protein
MGMNKRILPSKPLLQNMVYDFGVKSVLENYGSADMLMGSAESMEYYQSIRKRYESMERGGV